MEPTCAGHLGRALWLLSLQQCDCCLLPHPDHRVPSATLLQTVGEFYGFFIISQNSLQKDATESCGVQGSPHPAVPIQAWRDTDLVWPLVDVQHQEGKERQWGTCDLRQMTLPGPPASAELGPYPWHRTPDSEPAVHPWWHVPIRHSTLC